MKEKLLEEFERVFGGTDDCRVFFAPGRVNLIGEHTDYNGGHVFPCALTIGTYAVARKNGMDTCRFYSMNFVNQGIKAVNLDELVYDREEYNWANYPMGVISMLNENETRVDEGIDFLVYGNIPNASGLSSSASLEVLTAYACRELFGFEMSLVDIALLSQKAENKFIGVNCGIMDQFAIAMGKKDNAIFLDTATLNYEYAPIELKGAKIVITCSNKKRGLGDSKYNERRSECEDALKSIQSVKKIDSLGELTEAEFEEVKNVIGDETKTRRAKHAVYENMRTVRAVEALKAGDLKTFGELMNASHLSLQKDYEVTGIELDTIVETSWKVPGVIGARMTGAGFGGCTVAIVRDENVDEYIKTVGDEYLKKIGYAADFYTVEIGDGPMEL
ncbi:MAG: galactokinase [Lachnospiraceae bacterium]|nr:galactokinase [Lachnospiraceae bacterium]